jgi:hypothetical protein
VSVIGGGVVGSGTPDGQCQWSPCGSHSPPCPPPERPPVLVSAGGGGVVGSRTPEGQCQWSPWGSHTPVAVVVAVSVSVGGGVVGSGTPEGQCQWSPCGSQVPVVDSVGGAEPDDDEVGYGSQCPWIVQCC